MLVLDEANREKKGNKKIKMGRLPYGGGVTVAVGIAQMM
jgi:hypothetical protein